MLPVASHEPLASHPHYVPRLCSSHEVDVLTNVEASGPVDLREQIVSRCEKAVVLHSTPAVALSRL